MELTLLSNKAIFSTWPKCQDKNFNILKTKRAFKKKYKAFFIIFKELSLKQIKQFFLEGESLTLIKRVLWGKKWLVVNKKFVYVLILFKMKVGKLNIEILFLGGYIKIYWIKKYYQLCIDQYLKLIKYILLSSFCNI